MRGWPLALALLGACGSEGVGRLEILGLNEARCAERCLSELRVSVTDHPELETSAPCGGPVVIEGLPLGEDEVEIMVTAVDAAGRARRQGTLVVDFVEGETAEVDLALAPLDAPTLDATAPPGALIFPTLTLFGSGFGDAPEGAAGVFLGETELAIEEGSWSDTAITVTLPEEPQATEGSLTVRTCDVSSEPLEVQLGGVALETIALDLGPDCKNPSLRGAVPHSEGAPSMALVAGCGVQCKSGVLGELTSQCATDNLRALSTCPSDACPIDSPTQRSAFVALSGQVRLCALGLGAGACESSDEGGGGGVVELGGVTHVSSPEPTLGLAIKRATTGAVTLHKLTATGHEPLSPEVGGVYTDLDGDAVIALRKGAPGALLRYTNLSVPAPEPVETPLEGCGNPSVVDRHERLTGTHWQPGTRVIIGCERGEEGDAGLVVADIDGATVEQRRIALPNHATVHALELSYDGTIAWMLADDQLVAIDLTLERVLGTWPFASDAKSVLARWPGSDQLVATGPGPSQITFVRTDPAERCR